MDKKIYIAVAILLIFSSALSILHKEPNVGAAMSTEQITLCFVSYDPNEAWHGNPEGMLCKGVGYAWTFINGDVELLDSNTCNDRLGSIKKVELRTKGFYILWGDDRDIVLRPVFPHGDGNDHTFDAPPGLGSGEWSDWFDITSDTNAPLSWTFDDVAALDCDVEASSGSGSFMLFSSEVQIRVTY